MSALALSLGGARMAPATGRPAAPVVPMHRVGRAALPQPERPDRMAWTAPMIDEGRQRMPDLPEIVIVRSVAPIIKLVAEVFKDSEKAIKGRRRTADIVRPRQSAMWIARRFTGRSLPEIGRKFDRDHTTVLHACRRVDAVVRVLGLPAEDTPEAWARHLQRHAWPKRKALLNRPPGAPPGR